MSMQSRTRLGRDLPFTPENVLTLYRRAIGIDAAVDDAAGYDRSIINEDEPAEIWDAIMIVQHDGRPGVNDHAADLVSRQLLRVVARALKGGGIYYLLDRCDLALDLLCFQARTVRVCRAGGMTRYPENIGVKAVGLNGCIFLFRTDVTALDKILFAQRNY